MTTIFLTGGTGFIGKRLLPLLGKDNKVFLFSRKESVDKAQKIISKNNIRNIQIIVGDLEQKRLGLSKEIVKKITGETSYIYHLGASYHPSLTREKTFRIILGGTKKMISLAKGVKNLKNFVYISTAHVAGKREGKILENLPIKMPPFHNSYEEAKFATERFLKGINLPIVVTRPTMVVGDSKTGETDKGVKSGIYQLVRMIDRELLFFYPGKCGGFVTAVPVDWLAQVIWEIGKNPKIAGKTFHLAGPEPLTIRKFINLTCELLERKKPFLEIPEFCLRLLPETRLKTQMLMLNERQSFDMTNTTKFLGENNLAPPLVSYLPVLINYYKRVLR